MELLHQAQVASVPITEVLAPVDQALRAVSAGRLVNEPRRQTVGRPGDTDYFRLELAAQWLDSRGAAVLSARKVIEEQGATDEFGRRRLGPRTAELYLHHHPSGRQARMAADRLTDLRTGAAAVWAVRYFAPAVARLALIGTGRVARAAALAAAELCPRTLVVATSRSAANRAAFAQHLAPYLADRLELADTIAAAVAGAEAVIAAIPSSEPVFGAAELPEALVRVAVEGDPRSRLVAPEVIAAGPIVPDSPAQVALTGSGLAGPIGWAQLDGRVATLADAAAGLLGDLGRQRPVVLLTGLPALDLAAGWCVWQANGGPPLPPELAV